MAPTKRKRRSKHRGNAAGRVEARGRTGRKPTAGEQRKASAAERRRERMLRPPTWNAAILRAALAALLLFGFTQLGLTGERLTVQAGLTLALLSMLLYVPLGYLFDRWVYNKRLRQQQRKQQ
jgi:type VI protein secretion system component VasF